MTTWMPFINPFIQTQNSRMVEPEIRGNFEGGDTPLMHFIAEDLADGLESWITEGFRLLDVFLAKWAEFERLYGR